MTSSNDEVKQQISRAARDIYKMFGYHPEDDETFEHSLDPVKIACWQSAVAVFHASLNDRLERFGDDDSVPSDDFARVMRSVYPAQQQVKH